MPKRKNPNLAKTIRHHTCHNTGALKAQTLRQLQQSLLQSYLLCRKLAPATPPTPADKLSQPPKLDFIGELCQAAPCSAPTPPCKGLSAGAQSAQL